MVSDSSAFPPPPEVSSGFRRTEVSVGNLETTTEGKKKTGNLGNLICSQDSTGFPVSFRTVFLGKVSITIGWVDNNSKGYNLNLVVPVDGKNARQKIPSPLNLTGMPPKI